MNEALFLEIWDLMREYGDKKQTSIFAAKFADLLSENGIKENTLVSMMGHDDDLDEALKEILGTEDDEDDYGYDDE
jgi:hypothetical protein